MERKTRVWLAALCAAFSVPIGQGASSAAEWKKGTAGDAFCWTCESGSFICDARGRFIMQPKDQPKIEIGFFLWHDAWVYETLEAGKVETIDVRTNGELWVCGVWGTRNGARPLKYAMGLSPHGSQVDVRLELEKTGEVKLTDGIWATVHTAVTPVDPRMVYLSPCADAPIGKPIEGVFNRTFIGPESGTAGWFGGEGVCRLRSRMGASSRAFEVKFSKKRDFSVEEKDVVTAAFGFAPMPRILRPVVTDCRALALSARAPEKAARFGCCEIDVTLSGTWDNPYDPDDVALDAMVTTASGKTTRCLDSLWCRSVSNWKEPTIFRSRPAKARGKSGSPRRNRDRCAWFSQRGTGADAARMRCRMRSK
jgi:hypothetical protein